MSQTNNLKLFKHDNISTNTNSFDIEKSLNENWDKIDEAIGNNANEIEELNRIGKYDDTEIKKSIQELNLNKVNKEDVYTKEEIEEKVAIGDFKGENGKSAYEIAIQNGFEGTEEEWLNSLKGQDGIQGPQGEKGEQGERGLQGEKGEKGDTGEKGEKGNPFTFEDFTEEQLASLKGEKGDKGEARKRCYL